MFNKIAYQCDDNGIYIGEVLCQESPLEPGVWLCPGGATFQEPPTVAAGKRAAFDFANTTWIEVDAPVEPTQQSDRTFDKFTPAEKKFEIELLLKYKVSECSLAMERMQWRDWAGNPVAPTLKTEWFNYRKALLALPSAEQDDVFFINLLSPDNYPWPVMPVMPEEA